MISLENYNWLHSVIILMVLMPFLGALFQALYGKLTECLLGVKSGRWLLGSLAFTFVGTSFGLALLVVKDIFLKHPADVCCFRFTYFDWINLEVLRVPVEMFLDPLSITMVLLITGVGSLIHLYSTAYMSDDAEYSRFFTYLNMFIGFMLILVLSNNLLLLFVGWEGVGLCSYLLIGFWYKNLENAKAANKAFIVNRIGDLGLLLGIFSIAFLLHSTYGINSAGNVITPQILDPRWLSYDIIFGLLPSILTSYPDYATAIALLLFVGAMGKSAQFPLYVWLPDAMAGPTPVSALIHAATMVTSGIFLLNRMHMVFEFSPYASAIVSVVGAITAVWAALIAFGQTDIKKVLAYSTVSQLGYMFMACGVGAYWVGMFHVLTHAFFKALLFLGSGAVIYAMAHEQDMRRYGNLWRYLPVTGICMMIGTFAIAGIPLLSGFWSKEAILHAAFESSYPANLLGVDVATLVGWTGVFVAILTSAYMFRMHLLTFGIPFVNGAERWRLIPAHDHHHHHSESEGAVESEKYDFSDDTFNFYRRELCSHGCHHSDEHHALDKNHEPKEVPYSMQVVLVILAILSIFGGFFLHQHHFLEHFLSSSSAVSWVKPEILVDSYHDNHGVLESLLYISILAVTIGMSYALIVYSRGLPEKEGYNEEKWSRFRLFAKDGFMFDSSLSRIFGRGGYKLSEGFWYVFDNFLIDGIVNMFGKLSSICGEMTRFFQNGNIRFYIFMMSLAILVIIFYILKGGLN